MTYLENLAHQIRNAVPVNALPEENTDTLFLSYAVLLLAKGEDVTREDVHNAWVAWTISKHKEHESLIPFSELPAVTQAEDSPYVSAIRTVARRRSQAR